MNKRFSVLLILVTAALVATMAPATKAVAVPINKCALLQRNSVGPDVLMNRCAVCMQIKVERRRPTSGTAPTMRDYTLPGGARQPMPFKGPGSTRVLSEYACKGPLPPKKLQ